MKLGKSDTDFIVRYSGVVMPAEAGIQSRLDSHDLPRLVFWSITARWTD